MVEASRGACLVVGVGDGVGGAIARAFAGEGYTVCMTRRPRHLDQLEALAVEIRQNGGDARAYGVDARQEAEMVALVDRIEAEVGPLEVVVFNIGANVRFGVVETTAQVFSKVWEMACFAGFLTGREAARVMLPRGRGTILFTGASASLRGKDGFSAFASAKAGLRAMAQSLAREVGPKGIHVAHVVVDGAIDGVFTRSIRDDVEGLLARDEILKPDDIAANYVWLHRQPRSAWTHEVDLRPWGETW
ncbi:MULTISPECIES: SDR family NAD(P)-dependent oxidoreductase [unclassified Caulobacter]|uniref:SDR family NAD(P)-dependent oxidoreductase n=1 Tax=unclassified Caulobacter TaxID=2648921 RepID=UPI0006F3F314|nr:MULTISPECIES: SDR family NAD(P)-dependent oxidoreductase [unclassified Caulobacter]KQV55277.1 short-chain dehydrogenase [Caulobacter sp. Root342]KQV63534.1 short-chain dehydrogenase [Caulobacter sp. Root343]